MTSSTRIKLIAGLGLLSALVWAYWPVLAGMVGRWTNDPKYTHGYIVPLFAVWLLYSRWRREKSPEEPGLAAGAWLGLPVLVGSLALHAAGEFFYIDWLSEISLLPAVAAVALCVGGWRWARLAAPSVAYLVFMLPLPYAVEVGVAGPLQRVGAVCSSYLLQLIGFSAFAEGNIIVMNKSPVDVAEACSGLGMLVTFFALATAVAIVVKCPWWEKLVIFASAAPIAVAANVIRITLTGILFETSTNEMARLVYHEGAGLLMMTIGLLLLWAEMWLWSRVVVAVPEEKAAPVDIGIGLAPAAAPAPAKTNGVRRKNGKNGAVRI
jgi:exosortase